MSKINTIQVDDALDLDIVIHMYNLTEYNEVCLRTSEVYSNTIDMN